MLRPASRFVLFLLGILSISLELPAVKAPQGRQSDAVPSKPDSGKLIQIERAYGRLPLSFEANEGQAGKEVRFLSRGSGYSLFLTSTEAWLSLGSHAQKDFLKVKLAGAKSAKSIAGIDKLQGTTSYFTGNVPEKWRAGIPRFAKVKYEEVYPGIDMVYYGNQRELEFDFHVRPGADPAAIKMNYEGAKSLSIGSNGDLLIQAAYGTICQRKPLIYQIADGGRKEIKGRYAITHENQVGFRIDRYDAARPLIIDPIISYATYLGGSGADHGYGITVDSTGSVYIAGVTNSDNFPLNHSFRDYRLGRDAFVARLNPDGNDLIYSIYLGGSGGDSATAIAVDPSGNAYVTGFTDSADFPITAGAAQTTYGGGASGDAFAIKLSADGRNLLYSTYLGGGASDYGNAIGVDSSGNAIIAGATSSANFPLMHAFQPALNGTQDAFVSKLNSSGTAFLYSTFLGGMNADVVYGLAIDPSGNAYLAGYTSSGDFPVTAGSFRTAMSGVADAFVTKLNAAGGNLLYSTFLGGSDVDYGRAIAIDASGNAYVTGDTSSPDFPITAIAAQPNSHLTTAEKRKATSNQALSDLQMDGTPQQTAFAGSSDAYISKLNPGGTGLVYSTYLGGSGLDRALGIAVDIDGKAHVTGFTNSADFPMADPLSPGYSGSFGIFKSVNSATNWARNSSGLPSGDVNAIAIDPTNANINYAALSGYGLFKSVNGGASWSPANSGIGGSSITSIAIHSASPSTIYAAAPCLGIYKSTIAGLLWSASNTGLSDPCAYVVAVDPSTPSTLYAGTNSGVFKSVNSGGNWNNSSTGLPSNPVILTFGVIASDPLTIYAGGSQGLFKSTNGGVNWSASGSGIPSNTAFYNILVDPANAATVYASSSRGVYKSVNSGASWSPAGNGGGIFLVMDPLNSSILYSGGSNGIQKTTNSGANWSSCNTNLSGYSYVNSLAIAKTDPAILFTGLYAAADLFLTTLSPDGISFLYSSYLGGRDEDTGRGIALDASRNIYLTGSTSSSDLPYTPYAFQRRSGGGFDAFILKMGEPPMLKIGMNKSSYAVGEAIVANEFRLKNLGSAPAAAEARVWLRVPGLAPIVILSLGWDGSFILPQGFNSDFGPLTLFPAPTSLPRGAYEFSSRLINPLTGKYLSESLNPFVIQ